MMKLTNDCEAAFLRYQSIPAIASSSFSSIEDASKSNRRLASRFLALTSMYFFGLPGLPIMIHFYHLLSYFLLTKSLRIRLRGFRSPLRLTGSSSAKKSLRKCGGSKLRMKKFLRILYWHLGFSICIFLGKYDLHWANDDNGSMMRLHRVRRSSNLRSSTKELAQLLSVFPLFAVQALSMSLVRLQPFVYPLQRLITSMNTSV